MRYFARSISIFFPVCCLIYILLVCLWGEFIPGAFRTNLAIEDPGNNTYMRLHEVREYSDIDMLFLGSSRAYSGFDTRIFESAGYSSFNLGTSSQTPIQTKVLLERYLDVLSPELIIFEVSPIMFSKDGVESSVDIIANGQCDMAAIRMGLKMRHVKTLNTLIFRLYRQVFKGEVKTDSVTPEFDGRYINGGFVESDQMEYRPLRTASPVHPGAIEKNQQAAFESILELIQARDIQLILLQVPFAPSKYNSLGKLNQLFDEEMTKYGTYINLNEELNLVDTIHFRDELHLNSRGVNILNERIIDLLKLRN